MRPKAPIVIVQSPDLGATYFGLEQVILLSSSAASALSPDELASVIGHEEAHRNLYHVERSIGIRLAAIVGSIYLAMSGFTWPGIFLLAAGWILHRMACVAGEFEADFAAMRRTSPENLLAAFSKMMLHHPELTGSWLFRARLAFARRQKERRDPSILRQS